MTNPNIYLKTKQTFDLTEERKKVKAFENTSCNKQLKEPNIAGLYDTNTPTPDQTNSPSY